MTLGFVKLTVNINKNTLDWHYSRDKWVTYIEMNSKMHFWESRPAKGYFQNENGAIA